ncbi:hypothetical protein SAMN06265795_11925 [Noviherbaspirillum humi]|uniref:Uncharacterized protein n=1 Tax=Noviherbaspirillum humi TaxID=1688639 RepID=A0A239L2S8_9BURK|nr:hypothetical protein SAMN06265795_11925 [Noviherbaspirillum humi]
MLAALRRSVGLDPVFSAVYRSHGRAVGNDAEEVESLGVTQLGKQNPVQFFPHSACWRQSRARRQQVMPEPHFNSCSSTRQGKPVCRM